MGEERVHSSKKLLGRVPNPKSSEGFGGRSDPDRRGQGHRREQVTIIKTGVPESTIETRTQVAWRGAVRSMNIALEQTPSFFFSDFARGVAYAR